MRHLVPWAFIGLLLILPSACADARLICISDACKPAGEQAALDNRLVMEGNACTANPNAVGYPYKILFIVDVSGSTAQSDPGNGRGAAVNQVLAQYANNSQVYFAFENFDAQARAIEPNFIRDQNILKPLVPQLDQHLGITAYADALALAQNIIFNDANSLTETERARTRYDIEFLSDGEPNPCVSLATILGLEQNILDYVKTFGLFDIRLSTINLVGGGAGTCMGKSPADILSAMAMEGRGTYQELKSSGLKFDIAFSEILQPFSQQRFYIVNESRVVHNGELLPDSDRDGVADVDEMANNTDPTLPDTHTTGCGDRTRQVEAVNPNLCIDICAQQMLLANVKDPNTLVDTDSDGLHDCEEISLGIARGRADSDGDNLIDPLELRFGTNINDPATLTQDSDLDGTGDAEEILTGTDPFSKEPDRSLAYNYGPLKAVTSDVRGVSCFNYNVQNVQLVQTIATPTSAEGDNVICAYVEMLPTMESSGSAEVTVSRSCFTANYKVMGGQAFKTPATGPVDFEKLDFKPFICGSAPCP